MHPHRISTLLFGLSLSLLSIQLGAATITIMIQPQEAIDAGAGWKVQGMDNDWRDPGSPAAIVGVGETVIEYRAIFGYLTPNDLVINVQNDSDNFVGTGTYVKDVTFLDITSIDQVPAEDQPLDWEESVAFTITVEDNKGNRVIGAIVEVNDLIIGGNFQSPPTDAQGMVTYTSTVPTGKIDGVYGLTFTATKTGADNSEREQRQAVVGAHIISLQGDLDFGTVEIGSTLSRILTITNEGGAPLVVNSISLPTGFLGDFAGTIPSGSSQEVTLQFVPTLEITYSGLVTVESDASLGDNTLPIRGEGEPQPLSPPESVTATKGTFDHKIVIDWSPVAGITQFELWRNTIDDSGSANLFTTRFENTFQDLNISVGTLYYYWVKSKEGSQTSGFSESTLGFAVNTVRDLAASDGTSIERVALSWGAIVGAESYEVFRGTTSSSAEAVKIANTGPNFFDDFSADPGVVYFYWINALIQEFSGAFGLSDSGFILGTPKNVSATDNSATNQIVVTWDLVIGRTNYSVYRHTREESSEAILIATQSGTRFEDQTAIQGTVYFYWVTATGGDGTTTFFSQADSGYIRISQSLDDGVAAFYPFNGNANDESENTNNGEVIGATLTSDRFGNPGSAYSFDGVDDYIEISTNLGLQVGRYSLTAWIKTNSNPEGLGPIYSGKHDILGAQFGGFQVLTESQGRIVSEGYTAPIVSFGGTSSVSITDGLWHFLAATWDGSEYRVYLDGALEVRGRAIFPGNISWLPSIESLFIGKNLDDEFFNGTIDDLRLHNRALSEQDIKDLRTAVRAEASALKRAGEAGFVNDGTTFMGNIYNGFEMKGPAAVFSSIAGEITRVSFLDPGGDLVFAEFGSNDPNTTLLISLSDHRAEVSSPYVQPGTTYEQGLASFTIDNSTNGTFFSVFTLGNDSSRVDVALISSTTLTGSVDGIADIKRIKIASEDAPPTPELRTKIGGINLANANFTASSGMFGLDAAEVAVSFFLFIGDVTPSGTSTPWLSIHPTSTIPDIKINGGDLGEARTPYRIDTNGVAYPFPIIATDGQRSISDHPTRSDLGSGRLSPVTDTFVLDSAAYFRTGGQITGFVASSTSGPQLELPASSAHTIHSPIRISSGSGNQSPLPSDAFRAESVATTQTGIELSEVARTEFNMRGNTHHNLYLESFPLEYYLESSCFFPDPTTYQGIWIWDLDFGWLWSSPEHSPLFWSLADREWIQFEPD